MSDPGRVARAVLFFTCLLTAFGTCAGLLAQQVSPSSSLPSQGGRSSTTTPIKIFSRSETMYMKSQTLVEALRRQPEIDELNLVVADHQSQADLLVQIRRALLTWEWTYTITETRTGREIGRGKARAITAEGAANILGALIVRDIAVAIRSRAPESTSAVAVKPPQPEPPPKAPETRTLDASALERELRAAPMAIENVDAPRPTGTINPHAYALVIGAENYRAPIPEVPFALNDAVVMRRYFEAVLGVSAAKIRGVPNPALTDLKVGLMWLRNQVLVDGSPEAIAYVYYAGHGVPDSNGKPYLLPVDANPDYIKETGYAVDALVADLAGLPGHGVVFLDACFTGTAARGKGSNAGVMLGKRPAFVDTQLPPTQSRVSVFSAATGRQTSNALQPTNHGLFTYYLLQGFSEHAIDPQGRITVDSLQRYVTREVSEAAARMNQTQTPTISGPVELVLSKAPN